MRFATLRKTLFQLHMWIGLVLGGGTAALPPILAFAHPLRGNFLMDQPDRRFVGWLGVAMWLKKRRGRIAMSVPLGLEAAE